MCDGRSGSLSYAFPVYTAIYVFPLTQLCQECQKFFQDTLEGQIFQSNGGKEDLWDWRGSGDREEANRRGNGRWMMTSKESLKRGKRKRETKKKEVIFALRF